MTCDDVRLALGAYVLGALDDEEIADVEAHLDTCSSCRAELAELSGLPAVLDRVSEQDIAQAATPPRAVLERLIAASARRGRRRRRTQAMLALAASVVVAALGGTAWLSATRPTQDTSVTAISVGGGADSGMAAPRDEPESAAGPADQQLAVPATPSQIAIAVPPDAQPQQPEAKTPAAAAPESDASRAQAPSPGPTHPRSAVPDEEEVTTMSTAQTPQPLEARGSSGDMRLAVRLIPREGGTEVVARVSGVPAGTVCTLRVVGRDSTVTTVGSWSVDRGAYGPGNSVFEGSTTLPARDIRRLELTTSDGRTLVTTSAPVPSSSGG